MRNNGMAAEQFVIAGARGLVASHAIAGLKRAGISPVCLTDNDPLLWGQSVEGIPVLSPAEAAAQHGNATFVAAIFTHTPLRRQLAALGICSVIGYAALFRRYPECLMPYFAVDDPTKLDRDREQVHAAERIWADRDSEELYRALIQWHRDLDSDAVPRPLPMAEMYFPPFIAFRSDEVFVDCGAFDGDTVRDYLHASGGRYAHIIAFEPDVDTFLLLQAAAQTAPNITAINAAAGSMNGEVSFVGGAGLASHVSTSGANGVATGGNIMKARTIRLDDIQPRPTFVKMDIEGHEREALRGCSGLIRARDVVFAVVLYHRMEDLWEIPLFFHSIAPDLKLVLRHYAEDWAETVCYAVPVDRLNG
jgi:FkbM family methyltransferase